MVQWFRFHTLNAEGLGSFLGRELRSLMLHGVAKKYIKIQTLISKKKKKNFWKGF